MTRIDLNPTAQCSEKLGGMIFHGMEEIIGHSGVVAVLNFARLPGLLDHFNQRDFPVALAYSELGKIQAALEKLYGSRGGRGIALRSGRSCFNYSLREYGKELGLLSLSYRLMTASAKISAGLSLVIGHLSDLFATPIELSEQADHYSITIQNCPVCYQRKVNVEVCHLIVGFLQEFLYWISGGKFYNVHETSCAAAGTNACVIQIDKQAFE